MCCAGRNMDALLKLPLVEHTPPHNADHFVKAMQPTINTHPTAIRAITQAISCTQSRIMSPPLG